MFSERKNRIFIATFFDDKNQNICRLIDKLSSKAGKDLKIVPIEKIHITWKYIGYIDLCENEKVFNIVKEFSHIIKDCTLIFDKLEVWPNLKHPRLLSLTARNYDEKFADFFNNMEESLCENIKIKKEKKRFIPHITIARMKNNKNIKVLRDLEFAPINLDIKHTRVMQSINNSDGVLYKLLYNGNS